jgi:hypothetical protein
MLTVPKPSSSPPAGVDRWQGPSTPRQFWQTACRVTPATDFRRELGTAGGGPHLPPVWPVTTRSGPARQPSRGGPGSLRRALKVAPFPVPDGR